MKTYLIRRSIMAVVTVLVTIIITWLLLEYSPESPANVLINRISPSSFSGGPRAQALYFSLQQYFNSLRPHGNPFIEGLSYLWNFLHGNLGISVVYEEPVTALIAKALPWTLFIVSTSIIISFFIGIRMGEKMGYKRGTKTDSTLTMFFTVLRSIPVYILGILLLFFLAYDLNIFPTGGTYSPSVTPGFNLAFIESVLYYSILPILTLTLVNLPGWALHMRANTIYTLGEDYVTFAEIRGVSDDKIETKYVGRNSILPLYTSLILAIGFSFGGSIFVEEIFSYSGVGLLLYDSIMTNDYPLEMGIFVIIVLAVVIGVLLADLTYSLLDPRVRQE
ncbi:ABC transporter permease subunit [Acidianus sulfidivorans JP7]|uniref:ABC transporter permease n=1 Tax=Acidianus sulfidivorans JP7 TaxID=619593 RepID=A0A2U9ILI7_9CREN|nr:ABC transporter permease [Acidianus sulfidivorans]AWR96881.1 ABC transporter permease subunit [Acidianus sulfidivorans JP7]